MAGLMISLTQTCGFVLVQRSLADATHHNTPKGHERKMVSPRETLIDKPPAA